jgi:hypothetical protein
MKHPQLARVALCLGVLVGSIPTRAANESPAPGATSVAREASVPKVGALGNPQAIDFEGNQSFPAAALRKGLAGWPDFLLAGHPAAPLADCLAAIRRALIRGYQQQGFPEAQVEVTVDGTRQRIRARITEGPRFRRGEVRISGAKAIPAASLVRALTEPPAQAPDRLTQAVQTVLAQQRAPQSGQPAEAAIKQVAEKLPSAQLGAAPAVAIPDLFAGRGPPADAYWIPGDPAPFTDDFPDLAGKEVRRLLAERGHPLADVTVSLRRDPATHLAHLSVDIASEGPRTVLGTIEVTGCQRSRREDILRITGLKPGDPVTPDVISRAQLALWTSARFYTFDVTIKPRPAPAREVDLGITVEEIETLPALHEPLTRLQAALVRFANWMTIASAQSGLALTTSALGPAPLQAAYVPDQGLVALVQGRAGEQLGLSIDRHGARGVAGAGGRFARGEIGQVGWTWNAWMHLTTIADPDKSGRRSNIFFGGSYTSYSTHADRAKSGGQGPVNLDFILSPAAACLNLTKENTARYENEDVTLVDAGGRERLRFEEATGALREWHPPTGDEAGPEPGSPAPTVTIRPGQADFAQIRREIDALWVAAAEPLPAGHSFADLMVQHPAAEALLGRLLDREPGAADQERQLVLLARLAMLLYDLPEVRAWRAPDQPAGEASFNIPPDARTASQPGMLASLCGALFHELTFTWQPDAWPAKLARELFYLVAGQTQYTSTVLEELYHDPQMGPIGSVLTAQLLRKYNPQLAWRFARRAVEHGSAEEFRRDWQMLFDPKSRLGGIAREICGLLAELSDEDLQGVAKLLTGADATLWPRAAAELRRQKDQPADVVLQPFFDEWWAQHMQPDLENRIGALMATGPVDPAIHAVTINGGPVSRKFAQQVASAPQDFAWVPVRPRPAGAPAPTPAELAFTRFLNQALAYQDFTAQGGQVPDEHLDQLVAQSVQTLFRGNRGAFEAALAQRGRTLADHRELLRRQAGVEFMIGQLTRTLPPPAEAEIARAVENGPPAQEYRNLRAIAVRKDPGNPAASYAAAEALRTQLASGLDFEKLWKPADGTPPDGFQRLKLPKVTRPSLKPELAGIVFALAPHAISEVVDNGDVLLVIRMDEEVRESSEGLRRQARSRLVEQQRTEAVLAYFDRLRAKSIVRILDDPAAHATNLMPGNVSALRLEMEALTLAGQQQVKLDEAAAQPLDPKRWSAGGQVSGVGPIEAWLEWELPIAETAEYHLVLGSTRGPNAGRMQVAIDDQALGSPLELYAPSLQPSGAQTLGKVRLTAGTHRLRGTIVGRHPSSNGYHFGLDVLYLVRRAGPIP